jgi:hypothetical protein
MNGQSTDTGNIGYTGHRTKIIKTKTQHRKLKKMSNTNSQKNGGEPRCSLRVGSTCLL